FGPCRAAAETCGNACDDDGDGAVDEGCAVAPANDTCPTATPFVIGATITGTTAGATSDYGASCAAGSASPDVAYSFTSDGSPRSYRLRVDTMSHDGSIHVHSASSCASADEVACNDDSGGTRASELTLTNLPQGTYYVVVDGYSSGNAGPFTLTSSSTVLSPDTCAGVVPITANGTYTGTTVGRAASYTGTCGSTSTSADVVYSITARTTGTITVTTCGSSFDTVLYHSTACGGAIGCNDDSCSLGSSISIAATAGTTYYVVIDGYNGASGTYTLNVTGY
ncbi:MAG: hypothetical protein M3Y87_05225, partial [Myxococcota bacterium]|nr:hypothetical protein [Myxococcota bacterium]